MAKVVKHPALKAAEAKAKREAEVARQWICKRCKHDTGVETSVGIQLSLAPRIKGLRVVGGTKKWVCAHCWRRGIITEIF